MKCRNINENTKSAIFFGTSEAKWPKKIRFELSLDENEYKVDETVNLDYETQDEDYAVEGITFDISEEYSTNAFNISITTNNILTITPITCNDADVDEAIIHFIDENDVEYYQVRMTIENYGTALYRSIVPVYSIHADNYVENGEAIRCALVQKLSILKGELWFNTKYGLPLLEKTSRGIFDSYIALIINNQAGVKDITSFQSVVEKYDYSVNFVVNSLYGQLDVQI